MRTRNRDRRRGACAVEAAVILPLLIGVMFGIWEVGRLVQVNQILVNAAREGARVASGGYVNGTPVTTTDVDQAVRDYLTGAGFPAVTVTSAQVTLVNKSSNGWVHPVDAQPLDPFDVVVTIPAGPGFEALEWSPFHMITNVNSLTATVNWMSMKDSLIVVDSSLPL